MTAEEALVKVQEALDTERETKGKKRYDLPRYSYSYIDAVKQRDRIRVHADPDYFPDLIFNKRSPNQTDEQFRYVKENYQCTTNPVWQDFLNIIGKCFIDTNWQIIWDEEGDEADFKKYVTDDLPIYGSLETFIKDVLPPLKEQDANGVIAVRPYRFSFIETEEGIKIDDQERLSPTVYYHPCENVIYYHDDWALCIDDEKSEVLVADKKKKDGRVYYMYTTESIYKIIQVGKKEDNKYAVAWQYDHNEGKKPCTKLRGVPIINSRGELYWVSRFYYAVPLLDLALANRNILQVSINNSVFPFRVMMAMDCDFKDRQGYCNKGRYTSYEDGHEIGACSHCNGSGNAIPVSPLGVYLWQQPSALDNKGFPAKPVEYISPANDPLIFVREQVEIDTQKARAILHLQTSNSDVKGSENLTATGMALDMTNQYSFIRSESEQIFDLYDWTLDRIAWQRYETYDVVPTLIYPQSFDFRTELDIWNEIKTARESEAAPYVISELYYKLFNSRFASDPEAQAKFETLMAADQLFALSDQQIALRKAGNSIENWQLTLHHSGLQLINQIIEGDNQYLKKELGDRTKLLVDFAKNSTFVKTENVIQSILNGQ
jgi:hypothetical protein